MRTNNCLQADTRVNEFRLEFEENGGLEVIEKFLDHHNVKIKDTARIIINNLDQKPTDFETVISPKESEEDESQFEISPLTFKPVIEKEASLFN